MVWMMLRIGGPLFERSFRLKLGLMSHPNCCVLFNHPPFPLPFSARATSRGPLSLAAAAPLGRRVEWIPRMV